MRWPLSPNACRTSASSPLAQKAGVHAGGAQAWAVGALGELEGDGGIDAARQPKFHVAVRHGLTQPVGAGVNVGGQVIRVVALAAGKGEGEVRQEGVAVLGVINLRVEHHGVDAVGRRTRACRQCAVLPSTFQPTGRVGDLVAVVHHNRAAGCNRRREP